MLHQQITHAHCELHHYRNEMAISWVFEVIFVFVRFRLFYLFIYLFILLIFISPQWGVIALSLAYTCTYACAHLTSVNQA